MYITRHNEYTLDIEIRLVEKYSDMFIYWKGKLANMSQVCTFEICISLCMSWKLLQIIIFSLLANHKSFYI